MGFLRCTKVVRRRIHEDVSSMTAADADANAADADAGDADEGDADASAAVAAEAPRQRAADEEGAEDWNMSKFKILADCVSSLHPQPLDATAAAAAAADSAANTVNPATTVASEALSEDSEPEFVCVIRTSEANFVPVSEHGDVFVFSSQLSVASVSAHNKDRRAGERVQQRSSSGSFCDSGDSTDKLPVSSLSGCGSGSDSGKKTESGDATSEDVAPSDDY